MAATAGARPLHGPGDVTEAVVLADGPFSLGRDGRPLYTRVRIPDERLDPGPRGPRFEVELLDATGTPVPVQLAGRGGWGLKRAAPPRTAARLLHDTRFLAQHAYAVAAETLAVFERSLGRRVPFALDSRLVLRVHLDPAVHHETRYDPVQQIVEFGEEPDGIWSMACHRDVVTHEVVHAILHGLRPRWTDRHATLDQYAVHEAVADLVALLSVMSSREVVEKLIGEKLAALVPGSDPLHPTPRMLARLEEAIHGSGLLSFAGNFKARGGSIRDAGAPPAAGWRSDPSPYARASGFVYAMMRAALVLWGRRLDVPGGRASVYVAAEAGAEIGAHLRRMLIRGLSYMPPVDVDIEDLVRGLLAADLVVVPSDDRAYRAVLRQAFAEVGLVVEADAVLRSGARMGRLEYGLRPGTLDAGGEEIVKFCWNNRALLEHLQLNAGQRIMVDRVRFSTRVSPDGFVVQELGASVVQEYVLPAAEARKLGLRTAGSVVMRGGALLRFDAGGRLCFIAVKKVMDLERRQRLLDEAEQLRHGPEPPPGGASLREAAADSGSKRFFSRHAVRWERPDPDNA
ncbi:hypothetical protein ACQ3I4_11810 [Zafaria sp. Z1313]|uniref:hypothetical protein n=1 Tax=unclassified Zafaria TaxID=2828765 RepID=UPI002E7683E2|nr:hypothetical protein [Zafaria sp. J156]MEE1622039.1 hypothetical protein [Zafaria sp. J156]